MIKNYLKIAFRNLLKHKVYTIINAIGLSIGIGSCLFILVITQNELSFDQYHENKDRIYRMTSKIRVSENREIHTAQTPMPWGPEMSRLYPEIENYTRFHIQGHVLRHKDNFINETFDYADAGVFDIFTFPLIKGDPKTALTDPYTVVLSEEMAAKYFPGQDPVGQTIQVDNKQDFLITGLMKNTPPNSYLRYNFLASFSSLEADNYQYLDDWRSHAIHTYFLLKPGSSPKAVEANFPGFINTYIEEQYRGRYHPQLQPFLDMHLNDELSGEWGDTLQPVYIYVFAAVALFILLIACINFMNMATARSANRAKEVGLRKVLGAFRQQLIRQFLAESVVISFIALFFAIVFVEFAVPWFNSLTDGGRQIAIHYFDNQFYTFSIFAITLLVGILAGSYPAFFLSRFKPAIVLKGALSEGIKGSKLRKALVVTQFSIAILMIIMNFLLIKQIDFLKNKDLGFEKNNIIYFFQPENSTYEKNQIYKNELLQHPTIHDVFFTSNEPGDGAMFGRFLPEGSSETDGMMLKNIAIDDNYFPTLKIQLVAGRNFSSEFASDTTDAVIINETAARQFGWENPIGNKISWLNAEHGSKSRIVVGMVKDFNFENLNEPIQPLIAHFTPKYLRQFYMNVEPSAKKEAYTFLQDQWKIYDPNNPHYHYFLDVDLAREYQFEEIIAGLLEKFTVLTIFIACLGLLSLASFTAEQRTKEIGIRKVLGASIANIITMLSNEFLKLVLLANLFAWPLAYFAMDMWLRESFAYHINIGLWSFIICGVITLIIALLTIGYQSIKAAISNPIDALKYE